MSQKAFTKTAIDENIFLRLKNLANKKHQGISKTILELLEMYDEKTKELNQEKETNT